MKYYNNATAFCLPKWKSNRMTGLRIRWHLKKLPTGRIHRHTAQCLIGIWGKYLSLSSQVRQKCILQAEVSVKPLKTSGSL